MFDRNAWNHLCAKGWTQVNLKMLSPKWVYQLYILNIYVKIYSPNAFIYC